MARSPRRCATGARATSDWGFAAKHAAAAASARCSPGRAAPARRMAAEVLASELGLDLYRIDLAGVVSKYIGETEKNLRAVFDAAEASGAILFFDEADALFGKRTRGQGQPRPLRQHRGELPAAAHGGLPRPRDPRHQPQGGPRPARSCAGCASSSTSRSPTPPTAGAIWERVFPPEAPTAGLDFDALPRSSSPAATSATSPSTPRSSPRPTATLSKCATSPAPQGPNITSSIASCASTGWE